MNTDPADPTQLEPVLDDPADRAIQRISDLVKKSRGNVRSTLVEDSEPLVQALKAGVDVVEVYVDDAREPTPGLIAACAERQVPVRRVANGLLNRVFKSDRRPREFGVARLGRPATLADLADRAPAGGDLVILDGVRIVGNIGAIVRTSFALGAAAVVLVDSELTSIADRRLVRASRGYVFSLPVVLAERSDVRTFLAETGVDLIDVDKGGELGPADIAARPGRVALLLGAEKSRPADSLQTARVATVGIELDPAAESLNVSVAAGIVLHMRRIGDLVNDR